MKPFDINRSLLDLDRYRAPINQPHESRERDSTRQTKSRTHSSMEMDALRQALPPRKERTEVRHARKESKLPSSNGSSRTAFWAEISSSMTSRESDTGDRGKALAFTDRFPSGSRRSASGSSLANWLTQQDSQRASSVGSSRYIGQTRQARASSEVASIAFTRGSDFRPENGCAVACIANLANVSYATAREKAMEHAGFSGNGLVPADAQHVLAQFGIQSTQRPQGGQWSELPNLAIVTVEGAPNEAHAVIFRRKGGKELIYDWNKNGVVERSSDYKLLDGLCLEIDR